MSQIQDALTMLRNGPVCGTVFLSRDGERDPIPRYSAVIHTLKHRDGFNITKRHCQNEWHRHKAKSQQWEFILHQEPVQQGLGF